MTKYKYKLEETIIEDYVSEQEEELFKLWYKYNSDAKTYDLYEEKYEDKKYVDFYYFEIKEQEFNLWEYEIYKSQKVFDVKYKVLEKQKWFLGFFKNIVNKFIDKVERDVSESRISSLELSLSRWEIKDLQKIEKLKMVSSIELLTEVEEKKLKEKWIKYSFIRMTKETKIEKVRIRFSLQKIDYKTYIDEYESIYETEIINTYKKKVLIEKIIVDRRRVMESTINFYVPGIWSYNGKHIKGSEAWFTAKVVIRFISWFNPMDNNYFKAFNVKERVIEVIEKEHPNAIYIRQRWDELDWFNIEQTHIN